MNLNDHTQVTCSEAEVFAIQAIISSHGKFSFKVNNWLKLNKLDLIFSTQFINPKEVLICFLSSFIRWSFGILLWEMVTFGT